MDIEENQKLEREINVFPNDDITITEKIKSHSFGTLKITYEFIPIDILDKRSKKTKWK